jgi:hypothetical protein
MGISLVPSTPHEGLTLLSTTTLSGASVTLSSIPQTYRNLQLVIKNFKPATDNAELVARFNGDSNERYNTLSSAATNNTFTATQLYIAGRNDNSVATGLTMWNIYDYTNTTTWKYAQSLSITVNSTTTGNFDYVNYTNFYNQIAAISSIYIAPDTGNFTSGTALLYGVN